LEAEISELGLFGVEEQSMLHFGMYQEGGNLSKGVAFIHPECTYSRIQHLCYVHHS